MNFPNIIAALIKAQDNYDSTAYANCFSETAIVFDEGKTHNGRNEIEVGDIMSKLFYVSL